MVTAEEVPSLRVVDLKAELKARDLPISGLKAALVDRLLEALKGSEVAETEEPPAGEEPTGAAPDDTAVPEQADDEPVGDTAANVADTEPGGITGQPEASAAEPTGVDEAAAAAPADSTPADGAAQEDAAEEAAAEPAVDATAEPDAVEEKQPPPTAEGGQPAEGADEGLEPVPASTAGEVDSSAVSPPDGKAASAAAAAAVQPDPGVDAAMPAMEPQPAAAASTDGGPAPTEAEAVAPPAVEPVAAVAPASADGAEPLVDEEAPEMDFDVEPEEEPAAPLSTSKAAKETSDDSKPSRGKRAREPIPGVKAPHKVTTAGQHLDTPAAKVQRLDSGTTGSASTRKLSTPSDVPLLTPRQRSSVKAPPPNMEPTLALRIDNFMRPCTLPQVKQLLSQDGAVIKENCFWMNSIKTHCYVIFETAEQAEAIRQATFNVQFPRDSQKRLAPKFVTVEEAEGVISGTVSGTPRAAAAPAAATTPAAASEPTDSPGHVDARRDILERRQQRQQTAKPPPPQEEELGLDDLFRKTETAPHLYWLPKGSKGESTASSLPGQTANGKI